MPTTLLAVVALALIVLSAWVWMNVWLVRRARERRAADPSAGSTEAREAGAGGSAEQRRPEAREDRSPVRAIRNQGAVDRGPAPAPDAASAPLSQAADAEGAGWDTRPTPVEILQDGEGDTRRRVFEHPKRPFVLNGVSVPAFTSGPWMECFTRLTEDARVLGWVAFQGETLGAADREYEPDFLDVLRTYRRTVERVRKEVGLSHVVETSITGDEGKVWFLTGIDDTWFALFVERETNVDELSRRLLAAVTEVDPQA
ncbi:MAG: hypothetical protein K6T81_12990 [Alicyclobacillus macrosporangiidus]|uniref:hypothetical protein n=1 Tax=Alicyclobacillus macrosporangiidus TaxID=392015 RepID=UPI0026EC0DD2|nr:hypothetical protein [Alicyclobacillus macrosporangiidus]MCL6599638.1 hypothetical protein [Alicyclobacillus macrosporangiidus]